MTTAALPRQREPSAAFSSLGLIGWLVCIVLLFSDLWVLGPALFVFLSGMYILSKNDGPPVVATAFTYQWLQVTVALIYLAITGRRIADLAGIDPNRMVLLGLASVAAFFGGYAFVVKLGRSRERAVSRPIGRVASFSLIAISYGVAVIINFPLQRNAWGIPALTQILLILSFARYCLLYVLMTRLLKPVPRWPLILALVMLEVTLGFSGFFATFRESLVFIVLAILGAANRRRASTWLAGFAVAIIAVMAALTWTAIKPIVRAQYSSAASFGQRLTNVALVLGPAIRGSATQWDEHSDQLVSRMWMIHYPALALDRVPSEVPHENGRLLWGAVSNTIMPRMFFPEKGVLPSSSDEVRKYSGVYVTGRERNTSFAFGYVGESYVDFGWPLMLVPILAFGCLLGYADRFMRSALRSPDIRDSVRVVVLWSSMYLYEVSWVIMIGTTTSLLVVLVGGGMLFERAFRLGVTEPGDGYGVGSQEPGGSSAIASSRRRIATVGRIRND
jgi:hypothetical protein